MGLPIMSEVLPEWSEPFTIKTITRHTTNFVDDSTKAERSQDCVVQPADKRKLNPDTIDWAKSYLQIHSIESLSVGEYILFEGADYKIISIGPYSRYGYTEAIAESTEKALL